MQCDGAGGCGWDLEHSCSTNSECAHNNCECKNPTCTGGRWCSPVDCDCWYDDDPTADVACDGFLDPGVDDFDGFCPVTETCNGAGGCGIDAGQLCAAEPTRCAHGNCECGDPTCASAQWTCSINPCPCEYNDDADPTCDGNLIRHTLPVHDACGGLTCNGLGVCHQDDRDACSVSVDCQNDRCVNGFCCDGDCVGNCNRCNVPGSLGLCTNVDTDCTGECDQCTAGNCEALTSECLGSCVDCVQKSPAQFDCEPVDSDCDPGTGGRCAACVDAGDSKTFDCQYDQTLDAECDGVSPYPAGYECSAIDVCTGTAGASCAADGNCSGGTCGPLGYCCASGSPCAGSVSAGTSHTCATLRGGEAWCWGDGTNGAVGDGDTLAHSVVAPNMVTDLSSAEAIRLSCGDRLSCARLSGGTGVCWGRGDYGQLGSDSVVAGRALVSLPTDLVCQQTTMCGSPLSDILVLASGARHVCAVVDVGTAGDSSDDEARCWGDNAQGQLGIDSSGGQSEAPVAVCAQAGCGSNLAGAVAVAAGGEHTCVLLDNGRVRCWGDGYWGQLGDGGNGPTADQSVPVEVLNRELGTFLSNVLAISAGGTHTCAVDNNAELWCWGDGDKGQIGVERGLCSGGGNDGGLCVDGSDCPLGTCVAQSGELATTCTSGSANAGEPCAVLADCPGGACVALVSTAVKIPLSDVTAVAAGGEHTCAITGSAGSFDAWCWGDNQFGQLGDDGQSGSLSSAPVRVDLLTGFGQPVGISAGTRHTCAIDVDGNVWCWGRNNDGQVGSGTLSAVEAQPVEVQNWP